MTDAIADAIEKVIGAYKKEFGENEKMENGDELVGVFKDAVIVISKQNNELNVKISAGEPYMFEENMFGGDEHIDN